MTAPTVELNVGFSEPGATAVPWPEVEQLLTTAEACVLTTGTNQLHAGLDVVVEGAAVRVTEPARLRELAALWKSKLDWDFQVGDDAFRDPAGRTGLVFGVRPAKMLSFRKGPYTQTRYRFGS